MITFGFLIYGIVGMIVAVACVIADYRNDWDFFYHFDSPTVTGIMYILTVFLWPVALLLPLGWGIGELLHLILKKLK